MGNTKRKYSIEKAIADTRIQGKLILDENQVQAINGFLIELKAYRKMVKKIHSLSTDLETVVMKSLEEEISQTNSIYNNPHDPNSPMYQPMMCIKSF